MTAAPLAESSRNVEPVPARAWMILAGIVAAFCLLRGPILYRQIPAQDEDYFAVPGETILRVGLPRVPYLPSRNPASAFYKADEVLYALPPLYFYWQAAVYAVLGPNTGNARLASTLAGMAAVVGLYLLGGAWFRDERSALWGAGLYAFSRVVYFPCVVARPDMLCGLFGVLALWTATRWWTSGATRWLIAAGASIGLGLLTHPFAAIFALQISVWSLLRGPTWRDRLRAGGIVTVTAIAVFALWLPLIAIDPDLFRIQFGNNVLGKSGPGLIARFFWPIDSWRTQIPLCLEHVGPAQVGLLIAGLVAAGWGVIAFRDGLRRHALLLALGGIYLQVAFQGRHPTKGYWVYTLAPFYLLAGAAAARLTAGGGATWFRRWCAMVGTGLLAVAFLLPGSGVRTLAAHLQHWNDVNYDAARFTRQLLKMTPPEGRQVVDPAFIFDFHRAGRDARLALTFPFFYDVSSEQYDLLVAGPYSIRDKVPAALEAKFERAVGDRDDPFACYAELYSAPSERRPRGEQSP